MEAVRLQWIGSSDRAVDKTAGRTTRQGGIRGVTASGYKNSYSLGCDAICGSRGVNKVHVKYITISC